MNIIFHKEFSLQRPPWSGNTVRPWVRAMAWFFLMCAVFALVSSVVRLVSEGGLPLQDWLAVAGVILAELYLSIIFAHVAVRGAATRCKIVGLSYFKPTRRNSTKHAPLPYDKALVLDASQRLYRARMFALPVSCLVAPAHRSAIVSHAVDRNVSN